MSKSPAELAEMALNLHRAVAETEQYPVALSNSLLVLLNLITEAYPDLNATEVAEAAGAAVEPHLAGVVAELREQRAWLDRVDTTVDEALKALEAFGDDLTRTEASELLDLWARRRELTFDARTAILRRFPVTR